MAGNKKPRKAYKPKRVAKDPIAFLSVCKPADVVVDKLYYRAALDHILTGKGVIKDYDAMAACVNISAALSAMHFGDEQYETSFAAQRAHSALGERVRAGKPIIYRGLEIGAMKKGMELYESQADLMTQRDMVNASLLINEILVDQKFKAKQQLS